MPLALIELVSVVQPVDHASSLSTAQAGLGLARSRILEQPRRMGHDSSDGAITSSANARQRVALAVLSLLVVSMNSASANAEKAVDTSQSVNGASVGQGNLAGAPRTTIGLGITPEAYGADFCRRRREITDCATHTFVGGELSVASLVAHSLSLGATAGYGVQVGDRSVTMLNEFAADDGLVQRDAAQLMTVGLRGLYAPTGSGVVFGPRVAMLMLSERRVSRGGAGDRTDVARDWGAEASLDAGYEWWLDPAFALTGMVRVGWSWLSLSNEDREGTTLASGLVLGATVGGAFAID